MALIINFNHQHTNTNLTEASYINFPIFFLLNKGLVKHLVSEIIYLQYTCVVMKWNKSIIWECLDTLGYSQRGVGRLVCYLIIVAQVSPYYHTILPLYYLSIPDYMYLRCSYTVIVMLNVIYYYIKPKPSRKLEDIV